ncbi:MAG TPA: S49 family peptidase [Vicinamibacterales bacterium]|nr:S49 family peptidase [Vicinamibacterales bacterium]
MKYAAILRAAADTPWAIEREKLDAIMAFLALKASGADIDPTAAGVKMQGAPGGVRRAGAVAVIPIMGTIAHRASWLEGASGGTSTETIAAMLRAALEDPSVASIVLDVNSPGGSVSGVPELAAEIRAAREEKKIVAIANASAASAAYWLASQASEFWVTPSGKVGSIGVFAAHEDISKALEQEGVNVTLVHAGKHKVEANPFGPLSEDARAAIQADVDAYYGMFTRDVAKGRGVSAAAVKSGFGEGRMVVADRAVAEKMADRVGTLDELLTKLVGRKQGNSMSAASNDADDEKAIRDLTAHMRALTGGTR